MKELINIYDVLGWEEAEGYPKGTRIKTLRDEDGAKTVLLKLPKEFMIEPHSHLSTEQHFVIWKVNIKVKAKFIIPAPIGLFRLMKITDLLSQKMEQ